MMVENDLLCKENTVPNNAPNSDDSYSGASFPWFASQTKRKSRLGTHRKDRIRVLQDVVPNVSSELKPITLNADLKTRITPSESLDTPRYASLQPVSVSAFEPVSNNIFELPRISPPVNHFEPPAAVAAAPTPLFSAFEPMFSDFKPPSPSPHSTPMEIFDSLCNTTSLPPCDFKSLSSSPHSVPMDIYDPISEFTAPATSDTDPSGDPSSRSMSVSKFSDFRTPSLPSQPLPLEPRLLSDRDFKTPSLSPSPQSAPQKSYESVSDFKTPSFSPSAQSAPKTSFESVRNNVSPLVFKPSNVLQPSNTHNTNLKSSLKKPTSSPVEAAVDDKPMMKVRETTPRKEVRFAEPAPPPRSTTQKAAKELPAHITVKDKTYKVWRELGTGGSCIVYEVFDPEMNDTLAIKRVSLPEEEEHAYVAEGYLQEVQMLAKLQTSSDVIIKMFDHEVVYENDNRVLYVVLEKGEMDLSKYMRSVSKADKLHYILFCWRQMLMAVSKIHDEEIIHLDLKPANFLVVKGRLKLIDFGIASSMPGDKTSIYLEATSGTLSYTSPETLSMTYSPVGSAAYRISKKSDVWSLGCILYRWIYGHVPFHTSMNKWQRLQDIMAPEKKVEFPERKDVPEPLLRSLQSCLEKDPKKRPTVKELLQLKLEISLDQCMS